MTTPIKRGAAQIKESIGKPIETPKPPDPSLCLPTGSTLMNLACGDNPFGGYLLGTFSNLVGDSSSGKTIVDLTMLAEMAYNPRYDHYDLYYDDAERALAINLDAMFGKKFVERVITSFKSKTIEQFYGNLLNRIKDGKPFVYVLDSFDAIASLAEKKRQKEYEKLAKKAEEIDDDKLVDAQPEKEEKMKGTFGLEKPKLASELFRNIAGDVADKECFVSIISQTRKKMNPMMFEKKETRAGGEALHFYSSHELWLALEGKEVVARNDKRKIQTGVNTVCDVTKNKNTGKIRRVWFSIYYSYGIDDIGSCVDFMTDEKFWSKVNGVINAVDFDMKGKREDLIAYIEAKHLVKQLREYVGEAWNTIEEEVRLKRKPRFGEET
jgi:RecA/RadA recombinase